MIPDHAEMSVEWRAVDSLLNADGQQIHSEQVQFYVGLMIDGGHVAPPIIRPNGSIRDGRHRWMAHRLLGRDRIRVLVVEETQ